MVSKPCPRAGCTDTIVARDAGQLAKRKTCSPRCAMLLRRADGFRPPAFSREFYAANGRKGGSKSGAASHKAAMRRALQQMERSIPKRLLTELSREQIALGFTLIARALRTGYRLGQRADAARRAYEQQKGQAA